MGIFDHPPFYFPGTPRLVCPLELRQAKAIEKARPLMLQVPRCPQYDKAAKAFLHQFKSSLWRCNSMTVYLIPRTGQLAVRRSAEFLTRGVNTLPRGAIEIGTYHWPCSSSVFYADLQVARAKAKGSDLPTVSPTQGKDDGNDSIY